MSLDSQLTMPDRAFSFLTSYLWIPVILLSGVLSTLQAQVTEDFEGGTKTSYAAGTVDLETGVWMLDDALLGTLDGDRKHGAQSVRLRDGFLEMRFDFEEGANEVAFYASNAGFSGDTGGVIRVLYSVNGGGDWQPAGDDITLTDDFTHYSATVSVPDGVRFRIERVAGGRINIDDLSIEPYADLAVDPTLRVRVAGRTVQSGGAFQYPVINAGTEYPVEVRITNMGEPDLEIQSAELTGSGSYYLDESIVGVYGGGESKTVSLLFSPAVAGVFEEELRITSNDPQTPDYALTLTGRGVDESEQISIAAAREAVFGTRVTIAGRVTTADEFGGPLFMQDTTAGIAVYEPSLFELAERGDSIRVTGPVTEYNPVNGTPGTFLRQIAEHGGDDAIGYEIYAVGPVTPEPRTLTLEEMNRGDYEGQLIRIEGVTFSETGVFQGGQNYTISDPSAAGELRVDRNVTDLSGALIPEEPVGVTGVLDRFSGTWQIKPRDLDDLPAEPYVPAGGDIGRDLTFDVVTWNIEWFGAENLGPEDNDLQMNNVLSVIREIDADLYAFQEIASRVAFHALADSLEGYRGFTSYYGQTQQTAYLFRTAVVDSVDSGLLSSGQDSFDWAGRLPLFFEIDATVDGITRRIFLYNIHAKAFGDEPSYTRRLNAAASLKSYLDGQRADDRVIFLGDFNDGLTSSTYEEVEESPYAVFVEDSFYLGVTRGLEEVGFASYLPGGFNSMIDHIIINEHLIDYHIDGAQRVEYPQYIADFETTTSDHAPVWTRFQFTGRAEELSKKIVVSPNYPNPFNPVTTIPFTLPEPSVVTAEVFDILGRKVATIAENRPYPEGEHEIRFNAAGISSGVYLYRMVFEDGSVVTEKMLLVK